MIGQQLYTKGNVLLFLEQRGLFVHLEVGEDLLLVAGVFHLLHNLHVHLMAVQVLHKDVVLNAFRSFI